MTLLILGLVLFLGVHSTRIVSDPWRTAMIAKLGAGGFKAVYSVISLVGFVLIVWGYGEARSAGSPALYSPPVWTKHVAALLMAISFVLIVASKGPANRIRAAVGHPMAAGVKVWAFAHLLANGRVVDVVLFGAFLVWAVLSFMTSRRRDRAQGVTRERGSMAATVVPVVVGLALYVAFALWLHRWLIGVPVFG